MPAATCQVTDAEDGNSSFACDAERRSPGPTPSDGIGSQTASCSYTDAGGLTASASETYSIVDPSAPVISKVVTPATPDGANGWYTSDVTLDWTVSEPRVAELAADDRLRRSVDHRGPGRDARTRARRRAPAARAGPQSVTIKRDATAPTNVAFVGRPGGRRELLPDHRSRGTDLHGGRRHLRPRRLRRHGSQHGGRDPHDDRHRHRQRGQHRDGDRAPTTCAC